MISELEATLADRLGSDLPAPFGGRVEVAPGAAGPGVRVLVACTAASPSSEIAVRHLPGRLPEEIDRRLRLSAEIEIRVVADPVTDRAAAMRCTDALLVLLDRPEYVDGSRLAPPPGTDPGFEVHRMTTTSVVAPLDTTDPGSEAFGVRCAAEGWFWPVGAAEPSGDEIRVTDVRIAPLPSSIQLAAPATAGGAAVPVRITLGGAPRGDVVVWVTTPGGAPGAGSITGGLAVAAPPGARRFTPDPAGVVEAEYVPPAGQATDTLVLALAREEGAPRVPLARVAVDVR
jgi:hypothetical protein